MRPRAACRLGSTLALLVSLLVPAAAGAQAVAPAFLDLTVNRIPHGQIFVVLDHDEIWAEVSALTDAGLRVTQGDRRSDRGRDLVRLTSLAPGVRYQLDEAALRLDLVVQPSLLGTTELELTSPRPPGIQYQHVASGFLNYGGSLTTTGQRSLSLEGGASLGAALASSTIYADDIGGFRRGLTSVTIDDPRRLNRYVFGDTIASTGALGGSVQLAGASFSRDFSLDPYFVRYPTVGLSGAVMTPSRVEVYVNNQLVRVEQLPPGVYKLNDLPLPVGAADTRVVVRDAFGGEQTFASSYYISAGLLGRGLQQYAYAAGVERQRLFQSSWDYGRPVALALHRVGLTDSFTMGGRLEAAGDVVSGGPIVNARLGHFGEVEVVGAASGSADGGGLAGSLAYQYTGHAGSVAFAVRHASQAYDTLSTRDEIVRPRLDISGTVTARVSSRVTAAWSWQSMGYYAGAETIRRAAATANVGVNRRASLYVSVSRSLLADRWSTGGFAGLSVSLSGRQTASIAVEREAGRGRVTADAQRALPVGTGYGYRVQGTGLGGDAPADLDAELRGQTSFGRFNVRQTNVDGQASTMLDASGGLVFIGGGLHATRPVESGYALVRVPDVPDVRAYVSNQQVGRTNRHGELVVPNLLPYYGNRVSIADTDVPVDRDVPTSELVLAPPYRGGSIALFPAPRPWRVAGRIVVLDGAEIVTPSNWLLRVEAPSGPMEMGLGTDGAYYLEGLPPGQYRASVRSGETRCDLLLQVPASDSPVIRAGTTTCAIATAPAGDLP